jgi:hypothetical protein
MSRAIATATIITIDIKQMSAERYVSMLMASRNQAHMAHLVTNSFATHKALQAYYEGIIPLVDAWSEAYIGRYGRFKMRRFLANTPKSVKKPIVYFRGIVSKIKKLRLPRDSYLQSIQDEIMVLLQSTIYMLSLK